MASIYDRDPPAALLELSAPPEFIELVGLDHAAFLTAILFRFPGAISGRSVREFMLRARPEQQEWFLR